MTAEACLAALMMSRHPAFLPAASTPPTTTSIGESWPKTILPVVEAIAALAERSCPRNQSPGAPRTALSMKERNSFRA